MTLTTASRLRVVAGSLVGVTVGSWWWRHARSPKVQAWRPSVHRRGVRRSLAARSFGRGSDTIVLLHGLGATGDYWGATYDVLGRSHRVLVPDLLGFGRSIDENRASFGIADHLDALDRLLDEQAPDTERLTIVSHSMGSALALAWASRHAQQVHHVVCAGAPVYPNADAAREAVGQAGPMAKIFLLDTDWAQRACALSCAHRTASGFLAAVAEPSLPLAVTRQSVLHTWPAYRDALTHLVLQPDWPSLLLALDRNGVPVTLLWGAQDPIGDTEQAGRVTRVRTQTITIVPGADHHLPITYSSVVLEALESTGRTHPSR